MGRQGWKAGVRQARALVRTGDAVPEAVYARMMKVCHDNSAVGRPSRFATALLACAFAGIVPVAIHAPPVHAQSSAEKELQRLENERAQREQKAGTLTRKADQAAGDVVRLRQRLVAAARERDQLEREVERSEGRLVRLRRDERAANARLAADRDALEDVIIALIAVERDRPPALAVRPDSAAQAARAAILMGEVAPMLERRVQAIAGDIRRLRALREDILMQDRRYREANTRLQTARATIGGLIAERRMLEARLRRDAQAERARIAEIASRSRDLRDLIARLGKALPDANGPNETMPDAPAFASGFPQARGALPFPVAGAVTTRFGARLAEGGQSTGITIRARASAQVVSPYDGRVEFSGPFRTYGRVLIVNVGSGHHIVLAGLGATFAEAGQEVLAGEPVGEMSNDSRLVPDLYMEVREDGAPRDPALWLRRQNGI